MHFLADDAFDRLVDDLRAAALKTDWESAVAEVLVLADILPESYRADAEAA